jgi:ABC-type glutathione transport system ATPase component
VLRGIELTIQPGEVVGIVGRSGSGKSTLAKLVQRLYVPERGRVLVDGVDLALADSSSLRRQIGVVLQEKHALQPHDPRQHRARRPRSADARGDRCREAGRCATTSSSNCRKATTRSLASTARRSPAVSASASPSHAR